MRFEWDDEKERVNILKHGIDFSTAALVFNDENRVELYDEIHSESEERYITIGLIGGTAYIVFVVYTEREDAVRLISARKATRLERRFGVKNHTKSIKMACRSPFTRQPRHMPHNLHSAA